MFAFLRPKVMGDMNFLFLGGSLGPWLGFAMQPLGSAFFWGQCSNAYHKIANSIIFCLVRITRKYRWFMKLKFNIDLL